MRVGPSMNSQDVAMTARSFATLGMTPGAEAREALEAVAARLAPSMNAQNVATTLWSLLSLTATRGRGLHSSTFELTKRILWDAGAFRDCLGGV